MTTFSDTFTQGGQTQLHKFRMINQVFGTTLKISLLVTVLCFVGLLLKEHQWQEFAFLICHYKACVREFLSFLPKGFWDSSWVMHADGKWREVSDLTLAYAPVYLLAAAKLEAFLIKKLIQSLLVFLVSMVAVSVFWVYMGRQQKQTTLIRGQELVPVEKLQKLIKQQKIASDLTLAELPLLKDRESEHFLMVGTTGAGKSNAMNELLMQIRKRGDRAIIVDTTGGFVQRFYDEKTDTILNPLDWRSKAWNLWQECQEDYLFDDFAESVIPQTGNDPFWCNAARTILSVAAKRMKKEEDYDIQKLLYVTISGPLKEVYSYFSGTLAASMMDPEAEKTALSIRSTIASNIKCFEHLQPAESYFSIRDWVQSQEPGFVFLSCTPAQRATLRPLFSGWLSLATKAAMAGKQQKGKLWFIIDELASLNQLSVLQTALAEIRKYDGCFVLGVQNLPQLDEIYGQNVTRSICGLTGTKLIFRTPDAHTAKRMSEFLGEQEIIEHSESISFGAHQMRDGVSLAEQRRTKQIIPYTDLQNLPNLQAFIQLPCDFPVAKLTFKYHELENKVEEEVKEEQDQRI